MSQHQELRAELLELIKTNKEGFGSETPESKRIDTLIDELVEFTPYPGALNHADVFQGHWEGSYFSFGKLVGGDGAKGQGAGVTTTLRVFSMGRLPDIKATQVYTALEIDPNETSYNFYQRLKVGDDKIDTHHFTYGRYIKKNENLDRFFVEFDKFEIGPADPNVSIEAYCAAINVESVGELSAKLSPSPKLWSHVAYMDDDIRIQLGQMGGHYVMLKRDLPMYALEHARGNQIDPPRLAT
jgi:hypothetical protein